jgi:hypothetical protein
MQSVAALAKKTYILKGTIRNKYTFIQQLRVLSRVFCGHKKAARQLSRMSSSSAVTVLKHASRAGGLRNATQRCLNDKCGCCCSATKIQRRKRLRELKEIIRAKHSLASLIAPLQVISILSDWPISRTHSPHHPHFPSPIVSWSASITTGSNGSWFSFARFNSTLRSAPSF